MAENPLLPHAKLQELHALIVRCRALERKARASDAGAREALIAATIIHLAEADLLSAGVPDAALTSLAPEALEATPPGLLRLPSAAALARGLQAAGTDNLVLAYAGANTAEQQWPAALEWAHTARLPLVLTCADATEGEALRGGASVLTWAAMARLGKRLRLPVFPVDGEDAVAVFRVMQECSQRARAGDGPAVLWCVLSPVGRQRARSQEPLGRLESYMKTRGIPLQG